MSLRPLWIAGGALSVALGLVGIVLPLLPTTPFLLLAAFCFARGSPRLHNWLIHHPRFGPPIERWRERGAISKKAKLMAGLAMLASLAMTAVIGAPRFALIAQGVVLFAVAAFIFTRPHN